MMKKKCSWICITMTVILLITSFSISAIAETADPAGPVLYYKFDGSGTSGALKDYSGNAYDTTMNGTISPDAWSADGFAFSGANYIELPSTVQLVNPEMTVVFKVKRTGDISSNGSFLWGKNASTWNGDGMFINTALGLTVFHNGTTSFNLGTTANALFPLNEWTEVGYSIDTTGDIANGLLTINGVKYTATAVEIPEAAKLTNPSEPLNSIGAAGYSYNEKLTNMTMGKYMVYDRALTEAELLEVFNDTETTVDKSVLTDLLADTNTLSEAAYTPESWSVFAAALVEAETVAESETAVQADVDAAVSSLQVAMGALVIKPTDNKIKIDLQTEDQVTLLDPITFILSLGNMENVMTASFTFEVDGDMLQSTGQETLNGFIGMNAGSGIVKWTQIPQTTRWKGEATLMFLADPENGLNSVNSVDVFKLVFAAKKTGQTSMTLTGAKISGLNDAGEVVYKEWEAVHSVATTNIVKHYSIYDLNQDEVINQLDLTIAQRSYQKMQGEAGWDVAAKADVNGDGKVDMLDLVLIFMNYSD